MGVWMISLPPPPSPRMISFGRLPLKLVFDDFERLKRTRYNYVALMQDIILARGCEIGTT